MVILMLPSPCLLTFITSRRSVRVQQSYELHVCGWMPVSLRTHQARDLVWWLTFARCGRRGHDLLG